MNNCSLCFQPNAQLNMLLCRRQAHALPSRTWLKAAPVARAPVRCRADMARHTGPWRWAVRILGTGALATGVLVAALPSIVSTRLGLSASLAAVNMVTPGQVEVTSLTVGWRSPLEVRGLRVRDKASRNTQQPLMEVQRISSSAGLWSLMQSARLSDEPPAASDSARQTTESGNAEASYASASANDSGAAAAAARSLPCIPLVVQGATLNCEYDPTLRKFKLLDWLETVGLLSDAEAQPDHLKGLAPQLPGVSTFPAPSTASGPLQGALRAGETSANARSGGSEPPVPQSVDRGAGGDADSRSSQAPPVPQAAAGAAAGDGAVVRGAGRLMEVLSRSDSAMGFTADVKVGCGLQVLLPDGLLLVPRQIREMLGPYLHVTGAMGGKALREWADDTQQDASWGFPATRQAHGPSASAGGETLTPCSSGDGGAGGVGDGVLGGRGVVQGLKRLVPAGYQPGVLQAQMRLFRPQRGSQPTLLYEPAFATLEFTPALSRFGLGMVNPLLTDAVAVQAPGATVQVAFAPDGMQLPSTGAQLLVQPMSLRLVGGGLIADFCRAARISPEVLSQQVLQLQVSGMQVHVAAQGPITTNRVDMRVGPATAPGPSNLELSLWGQHDPDTGALDMVLGLPAPVLQQLGVGHLPEGYLLPVRMRGSLDEPSIDYKGLVSRLGGLVLRQQYLGAQQQQRRLRQQVQGGAFQGGLLGQAMGVVSALQLPELDAVRRAEQQVAQDMLGIPRPWTLPIAGWEA